MTHHRMFTSKVWTDDSRLLQESNLAARQSHRSPLHVIQATTSEGHAQGPYVAARVGFEPATFCTEHHQAPQLCMCIWFTTRRLYPKVSWVFCLNKPFNRQAYPQNSSSVHDMKIFTRVVNPSQLKIQHSGTRDALVCTYWTIDMMLCRWLYLSFFWPLITFTASKWFWTIVARDGPSSAGIWRQQYFKEH